ncbi:hypothetical protein ACFU6K_07835 [Kitasatospora sp. NPDC057512]|uniref:hypothetical protein n=1 Tax=Kitasatospora sp. NPDC057512 TaxID=3346154 RepID=UPI0036C88426
MGKASRKKQERRTRERALTTQGPERVDDSPRALGEQALARLLRSSPPGRLSLAGAYAVGYATLGHAQLEGTEPTWYQEIDPLDALYLGTAFPGRFRDEFEFANSRDAWLRLLRGTVHEKGIQRFVREAVSASEESGLPVDDGEQMLALTGRLEAVGLDQRRLPRHLLPGDTLQNSRAVWGPPRDLLLPDPPKGAKHRVQRFWQEPTPTAPVGDTPEAVLRKGLHRFASAGLPVREEAGVMLPALYAALLVKPGEHLEETGTHARAWALSMNDESPLVPVLDILLAAPELGLSVNKTLKCLYAVPAFTEPIPSADLVWTSSPGLALPRMAFELGIPEVSTLNAVLTPDLLDWAGTRARMRLSAAGRRADTDTLEADSTTATEGGAEESEVEWTERRQAVLDRIRRKSGRAVSTSRPSDRAVERVWNGDGSSVLRIAADSRQGREMQESLEKQFAAFREKFGREPEPHDPIFFDPDADEPVPLSRGSFDSMMQDAVDAASAAGIDPAFVHAWQEVGYVVTTETLDMFTTAEVIAYRRAVERHRRAGE